MTVLLERSEILLNDSTGFTSKRPTGTALPWNNGTDEIVFLSLDIFLNKMFY